ncbi:MAG: hypothetical protein V3T70_02605, partial [Phycisphaerae bacterium]
MELQLASQLPFLETGGVHATILSSRPPESLSPELTASSAVHAFDARSSRFSSWLRGMFRQIEPALIHARGLWVLPDSVRAARAVGDSPVVFSFHGL